MTVTLRAPATPATTADGAIRQPNSSRTTPKGGFRDNNAGSNNQIVLVGCARATSFNAYLLTSANGTTWSSILAFALNNSGEYVQSAFQDSLGKVHVVTYSFADGPRYYRVALNYTGGDITSCTLEASFVFTIDDGVFTADNRPDMCELVDGNGTRYIGLLNSCSRQANTGWRINLARFARDITAANQITGINGTGTRTQLYSDLVVSGHERLGAIVQFDDRTIGIFGGYCVGEIPGTGDFFAKAILPPDTNTTWTLNTFTDETTASANHGNVIVRGNTAYRCRMTNSDELMRVDSITSTGTLTLNVFPTVTLDASTSVLEMSMSPDATKVYAACVSYNDNGVLAYYDGSSWTRQEWSLVNWGGNAACWPRGIAMIGVNDDTNVSIITVWDDTVDVVSTPVNPCVPILKSRRMRTQTYLPGRR